MLNSLNYPHKSLDYGQEGGGCFLNQLKYALNCLMLSMYMYCLPYILS